MSDERSPLDNLSNDEVQLYLHGRPTNPDYVRLVERINADFSTVYGDEPVSVTPVSMHGTPPTDEEMSNQVLLPGGVPTPIGRMMAQDMRDQGYEPDDLDQWKMFATMNGIEGMKLEISRLQELSVHPDYDTEGTEVNKEARRLITRIDLAAQGYAVRRGNRK